MAFVITETSGFELNLSKHFRAAEKAHLKLGLINRSLVSRTSEVKILTPPTAFSAGGAAWKVCALLWAPYFLLKLVTDRLECLPRGRWWGWGKGIQSSVIWRTGEGTERLKGTRQLSSNIWRADFWKRRWTHLLGSKKMQIGVQFSKPFSQNWLPGNTVVLSRVFLSCSCRHLSIGSRLLGRDTLP